MCGIAGILYSDPRRACGLETITAMRDVFPYRGPDDAGVHVDGPVGLGQRRLSIIDLGGGHQPMSDEQRRFWIVFNGEIYNYRSVRQGLISRGCRFHTESDTEVVLQLFAARGETCVQELNGMFAFAIWDSRQRSLFLARDRMGVKPLYYAQTAEALVFASEIKSLFASGTLAPRCREEALAEYMAFRQVAGSETMFRGVSTVPPGCTMTVTEGGCRVRRFWSPHPQPGRSPLPYTEARQRLAELLEDSIRLRLLSDVPLGTFCSGGLDSSLVTAIAARLKEQPLDTFSVGFDEPDFDESTWAEAVSRRCGTIHHALRVGNAKFNDLLPRMIWHNDEPLNFANSIQIFALSELARQHVTVVLTGEGADELFAGYPRYRIPDLTRAYRRVPPLLRRLLGNWVRDHRLGKLNQQADSSPEDILLQNAAAAWPGESIAAVYPGMAPLDISYRRQSLLRSAGLDLDSVARLSLLDQETYLVSILQRQDKMSMAASIEARVPFLDYRIVELANQLPTGYKIKRTSGKAIVKDVAGSVLPSSVVHRRKSGFGVPLARWFRAREGLGERLLDLDGGGRSDMADRAVLRRLVRQHKSGERDHSEVLWTVLNLELWREAFRC